MARTKLKQESETTEDAVKMSSYDQIQEYLKRKENKDHHYNFEETISYTVSSGSLLLDLETGGGLKPGCHKFSSLPEGGKTSCALSYARNFQNDHKDGVVVYFKAEGRLDEAVIKRAGISTDKSQWMLIESNIFEFVVGLLRTLVFENPNKTKYFFIIDSMDALLTSGDIEKKPGEANKVAGGALLSSDMLKRMSLAMSKRGHILIMIGQYRSTIKIDQYAKADPKQTVSTGGHAHGHYASWVFEFQQKNKADKIFASGKEGGEKDEKPIGHFCKIIFRKSINEKTDTMVQYPIKYAQTNGQSIWREKEIIDLLTMWDLVTQSGAWINVSPSLIEELKKNNLTMPDKINGGNKLFAFLESNPDVVDYLYTKFRTALLDS